MKHKIGIYSPSEVAVILGVSVSTIYKTMMPDQDGDGRKSPELLNFRYTADRRHRYVTAADIDRYLRSQYVADVHITEAECEARLNRSYAAH